VLQPDGATVQTDWVGCYDRKDYDRFETLGARDAGPVQEYIDAASRLFSEAVDDNRRCVRLTGEFYCLWTAITILW
jgi:hypothetical protein